MTVVAMGSGYPDDVRRLVKTGMLVAGLAVGAQTVLYLVDVYTLDRSVDLFDLEEGGVVTWATSSAAFSVGFVAFLLSFLDAAQRVRGVLLALGMAFISFDDAVSLHERMAFTITEKLEISDSYVQVIWPSVYFPLLVGVAVLLLQIVRDDTSAHRLVVVGLVVLAATVVLEMASFALSQADVQPESWLWTVEIAIEEGAELAGWIVVATGMAARLVTLAHAHGRAWPRPR